METAAEHVSIFSDSYTWITLSAVLFVLVAYFKGKGPILELLDSRTDSIRIALEEALRLRQEAEDLLADYQKKHSEAVQTAARIIENAKASATLIEQETQKKLDESLKIRETLVAERIARAEAQAVLSIRNQAADIAANAAQSLLQDTLSKNGNALVDNAIAALPKQLQA